MSVFIVPPRFFLKYFRDVASIGTGIVIPSPLMPEGSMFSIHFFHYLVCWFSIFQHIIFCAQAVCTDAPLRITRLVTLEFGYVWYTASDSCIKS